MQLIRQPEHEWDLAMIKRNITRAGDLWQIVDRQLGQTRWLAGEDFTMGDVPLGIPAYTWMGCRQRRLAWRTAARSSPMSGAGTTSCRR